MKGLKVILFCLVMIVLLIAVWQNIPPLLEESITFRFHIDYLDFSRQSKPIPVIFVVPLFFLVGMVFMYVVNLGTLFRLRRKVKRLEREHGQPSRLEPGNPSGTALPESG